MIAKFIIARRAFWVVTWECRGGGHSLLPSRTVTLIWRLLLQRAEPLQIDEYRVTNVDGQPKITEEASPMVALFRKHFFVVALGVYCVGSTGCALRLYAPVPSSEDRLKVIAKTPDLYVLHVEEHVPTLNKSELNLDARIHPAHTANYEIPKDGLISIRVPSYRPNCGVYLFNLFKVGGGGDDALRAWKVSVLSGTTEVRVLSLQQVRSLPTNAAGYHLLKIRD